MYLQNEQPAPHGHAAHGYVLGLTQWVRVLIHQHQDAIRLAQGTVMQRSFHSIAPSLKQLP